MRKVAYLTHAGPDPDREVAIAAAAHAGISLEPVVWHDPAADWSRYDRAIVRSTWDYAERRTEFLGVLRLIEKHCPLSNSAEVVEWNTHKTYLRDLALAGCEIVPTLWIDPRARLTPSDVAEMIPVTWTELAIKPMVGAGASGAMRTADLSRACAYATSGDVMMIQPYLQAVDTEGEISLIFIGGAYSHAVRRSPYLTPEMHRGGLVVPGSDDSGWGVRSYVPDASQIAIANAVMEAATLAEPLLYARVDLIRHQSGQFKVAEFEAAEPFLFLGFDPQAPERLATAIVAAL